MWNLICENYQCPIFVISFCYTTLFFLYRESVKVYTDILEKVFKFLYHVSGQLGIHGLCKSSYVIEEDEHSTELSVTQVVDIRGCRQRAEINTGMALAIENELSKQVSLQLAASVLNTICCCLCVFKACYNTLVSMYNLINCSPQSIILSVL